MIKKPEEYSRKNYGENRKKRVYYDWTPQKEKDAIDMCDNGSKAIEIANYLGTTRNAVIGMLYRKRIKLKGPIKKDNIKITRDAAQPGRVIFSTSIEE